MVYCIPGSGSRYNVLTSLEVSSLPDQRIRPNAALFLVVLAMTCACTSDEVQEPDPLLEPEWTEAPFLYSNREDDIEDRACQVVLRTAERMDPACVDETCWLSWRVTFDVDEHQLAAGARPGLLYESSQKPDRWWMTGAREAKGAGEGFVRHRAIVWKHTLEAERLPYLREELVIELVPFLSLPSDTRIIDLNRDRSRYRHNPLDVHNDWSLSDHPLLCTGEDLWALEPVGTAEVDRGDTLSLALDSQGRSHVLYPGPAELLYIRRDEHGWSDPVVVGEATGADKAYVAHDLAMDHQDRPHVAFCWADYSADPPTSAVGYLRPDGPTWQQEDLTSTCSGWDLSLVLDAQGVPHLAWAGQQEGLYFSSRTDAGWVTELVAPGEASSPTLGFDDQGRLHLVYFRVVDFGDQSVIVLDRQEDGTWEPRPELQDVYVMRDRSAVFDSHGRPHLGIFAYILGYATLEEQEWLLEEVDTTFHCGLAVSIAVHEDAAGAVTPMMSYWDSGADGIALAWKAGGRWYHIAADFDDPDASYFLNNEHTAIAIGPDGRPHFVYSVYLRDTLMYAAFTGPAF
jgi:hypothetical protein